MQKILSLIADPAKAGVDEPLAEAAGAALESAGAETTDCNWLAAGVAAEIGFDAPDAAAAEASVRERLAGAPVDIVVQPAEGRRKELLVADMESTIIQNELVDDMAEFVGVRHEVAKITAKAMNGDILFRPALRDRLAYMKGLEESMLEPVIAGIEYMPGARVLVRTMRRHGAHTALVSGGFTVFTAHVRKELGFDFDLGNDMEIVDGRLTGKVVEPVLGRDAKRDALLRLSAEHGAGPRDAVAVGDGFNDLPMIEAAGLGVAYHAKQGVAAAAAVRIDHGDLTALLFLQGYRPEEFVE